MGWGEVGCLYLNGGDLFEPEMAPPSFTRIVHPFLQGICSLKRFSLPPTAESTEEVWTQPDVQGTEVSGSKPAVCTNQRYDFGLSATQKSLYYSLSTIIVNRVRKDCSRHEFAGGRIKTQALNLMKLPTRGSTAGSYVSPNGLYAQETWRQNEKCDTRPATTKCRKYVRTTK
jgi:hypothetical protein